MWRLFNLLLEIAEEGTYGFSTKAEGTSGKKLALKIWLRRAEDKEHFHNPAGPSSLQHVLNRGAGILLLFCSGLIAVALTNFQFLLLAEDQLCD